MAPSSLAFVTQPISATINSPVISHAMETSGRNKGPPEAGPCRGVHLVGIGFRFTLLRPIFPCWDHKGVRIQGIPSGRTVDLSDQFGILQPL